MPQGQDAACHGNGATHCCWWQGEPCPFLEENTIAGRRWACGLMRELGDWDVVHADPRYAAEVEPRWRASGPIWEWLWDEGVRCGDWGVPTGSMRRVKAKGNDPQVIKDFQSTLIEDFNRAQQGTYVQYLCCFGNEPEA